ncbi:MAG: hypothetical protein RL015_3010 [Verrucomicrobiota bacterium]|jgi:N-acetylneuraminic acid mutarotase
MKNILTHTAFLSLVMLAFVTKLSAQVPQLISYQGRVGVDGVNFDGSGQFKFAFVNAAGTTTYWSNDGSSMAGREPDKAISIPVSKGLYSVLLGDATLAHMSIVPATVFTNGDVHLRVWFSDGVNGFQQLAPDRRIAAVGYAMMADSVSDGAITTAKIADGAVTSEKLAAGVVQTANLATGAVGNTQLANSGLTINAGTGLGGGGLVSLGGNLTLSNAGVLSITGGGGITVDAGTGAITLGSSATSAGTAGAIVARDASGGFTAGTITAALNGNAATATMAGSATNFTGTLAGDVTGIQAATTIADATVTGKVLTGFTSAAGTLAASDTLLSAISKLDGNTALKAPLASPTFTGRVTLPAGTATTAPLLLQTGPSLTTPAFGALEFDGTNVFVTNNSANPTRKTVAFTDTMISASQIADGSVTSAKLANGSIGSAQLAVNAVQAENIASGAVGAAQLATGAVVANLESASLSGVASSGLILSALEHNSPLINAGYVKDYGSVILPRASGRTSTVGSPIPRTGHTAVWTNNEMIVWGGIDSSSNYLDSGGRYNPIISTWETVKLIDAPTPRASHTAIWTGSEMIVWGGKRAGSNGYHNNGARYNPTNDSWIPITNVGSIEPRALHTAIWTGSEMIIWGGFDGVNNLNSGARYKPSNNSWSTVSSDGAPAASSSHYAIWTGTEMIIWGGSSNGSRYDPTTNTWTALSTNGQPSIPSNRSYTSVIWTGTEMIVWGGRDNSNASLNDGFRYNPLSDTWTTISKTNAPSARYNHSAIWTGIEMIIYGGSDGNGFNGRYSPLKDSWSVDGTSDERRIDHTAIWTGRDILIWGGRVESFGFDASFVRYTPGRQMYLYQRP